MGDFTKLNIQPYYKNRRDDIINDFYIPVLKEAKYYKRAVGFFSSKILVRMAEGLCSFAENKKKIQLIVSTSLEKEDYDEINKGYMLKEQKIEKQLLDSMKVDDEYEKDRLSLLAYLISIDCLDVKIAFLKGDNNTHIYHEKLGIMCDDYGNIIAFSGSPNETVNGLSMDGNYETMDVFTSWKNDFDRCISKEDSFDMLWNNHDDQVITFDFPKVVKEEILKYVPKNRNEVERVIQLDKLIANKTPKFDDISIKGKNIPYCDYDTLRDYQKKAIEKWVEKDYCGIYDMATGTGKTFTACGSICKIFENKKRIFVVVVCPYTHLVEQWGEEAKKFNIEAVLAYGTKNKWFNDYKRGVTDFELCLSDFFCVITTNNTYRTEYFQELLGTVANETLLVIDEAHNFGATNLSKHLRTDINYRLALSATFERYMDDVGTAKLLNYFKERCFIYSLEEAINTDKLTKYYYYPILITLDDDELEEYTKLSNKIIEECARCGIKENDRSNMSQKLKSLLIKRARLIAGARQKLSKLKEILSEKYINENNMLIYCGATTINDYDSDESYSADREDIKQIDRVLQIVGGELGISADKFTSEESSIRRKEIKEGFVSGLLSAIIAIKCLDEGVDIPAIKTAFILASSTNPREYVQRRGRVLRKFKGKEYAVIYDFVTLTRDLNSVKFLQTQEQKIESSLAKREIVRVEDFSRNAINSFESFDLINNIKDAYGFNIIREEEL